MNVTAAKKPVIVSLGGNAIIRRNEKGLIEEQFRNARLSAECVARLASNNTPIVITHGNGPIVGNILIQNEAAKEKTPQMPLYMCDADSEGGIGFMLQQTLHNELVATGKIRDVATIVTQVVVDRHDSAFKNPSKPVGPFYSKADAEKLSKEAGYVIKEDSGRGYRRVVASPHPEKIIEANVIRTLAESGVIVIAAGGGGVPVIEEANGSLKGIDAVIDKDLATALLGKILGSELLIILTQVEAVYLNFGKLEQTAISKMTATDAKRYLAAGEFLPGSMGPKIEAAIEFLENGGKKVIITTPELITDALSGKAGTRITS